MRRHKRDRNKPIPVSDLQAIAKFAAELKVCSKLREQGLTHEQTMQRVFGDEAIKLDGEE